MQIEEKVKILEAEREKCYKKFGELSPNVLSRTTPIVQTASGPITILWPANAIGKLRIIHRKDSVCVVTDGLSNPWDMSMHDDVPMWTFGMELMVETNKSSLKNHTDQGIAGSWMPTVMWALTDWIVYERVQLKSRVQNFLCSTAAIPPVRGLEEYISDNGFMGSIVGIPNTSKELGKPACIGELHGTPIELLTVKLLRPEEYEWAINGPNSNTLDMARAFLENGDGHLTNPGRPSVLPLLDPNFKPVAQELNSQKPWWKMW